MKIDLFTRQIKFDNLGKARHDWLYFYIGEYDYGTRCGVCLFGFWFGIIKGYRR